jgi:hypothetical protein
MSHLRAGPPPRARLPPGNRHTAADPASPLKLAADPATRYRTIVTGRRQPFKNRSQGHLDRRFIYVRQRMRHRRSVMGGRE